MNPAYKHVTDRLRIAAELTTAQVAGLLGGVVAGLVFALYISPFGAYVTLCLSIYIACIPAGTVLLATSTEFDLTLYIKACIEERTTDGRYTAGAGQQSSGYEIEGDETPGRLAVHDGDGRLDLEALWDL
jgi:hypothetical protein